MPDADPKRLPALIRDAYSMPLASPSYPRGPYRFVDREYLLISYESDPEAVRAMIPEPLVPEGSTVVFEWMRMPDSTGFGSYTEAGQVIPCTLFGEKVSVPVQMFLNDEPPITGGREIWGFPKKWAEPELKVVKDTLTGTLAYGGERVAMGTMGYKHERAATALEDAAAALAKTQVTIKVLPDVDGGLKVAQLVRFRLTEIAVKGAWSGPARLDLIAHVGARVADLPVRRVLGARHYVADLTLPYGEVAHDYLAG